MIFNAIFCDYENIVEMSNLYGFKAGMRELFQDIWSLSNMIKITFKLNTTKYLVYKFFKLINKKFIGNKICMI
ncbi:hypothetical protein SAMN05216439_0646 [Methanobrevibacter gottschalkii]|uniref:Uncharacterized protein n=1 Tax=Methanobrevibacter gottschalkii TaxID=190974 RepID=A0A1H7FCP4_9EURY|nr:hypothetical protein SAMN05216439_0646 [Methanobrevibacter gottschalkii]